MNGHISVPDVASLQSDSSQNATHRAALEDVAQRLCSCLEASHAELTPEKRAVEIVKRTVSAIPADAIAISFNGGKDAVVMLELLLRTQGLEWLKECFMFVLIDTEGEFPELVEFRKEYVAARLPGVTLHEIEACDGMRQGLWRALEKHHFLAAFMGTRKDDPGGKYQQAPWKVTTPGWPPMVRVCPILSWTFGDVWEYTMANSIPYCKLYLNGYTSLGDSKVTSPNVCLQKKDGTYAPAWTLTTECEERAGRTESTP